MIDILLYFSYIRSVCVYVEEKPGILYQIPTRGWAWAWCWLLAAGPTTHARRPAEHVLHASGAGAG